MIDLASLTIGKAKDHLAKGDFSARELAEAYLSNIEKKNGDLNAYLETYGDVLAEADRAKGGALSGIPIAVKDNILVKGKKATAGSKILESYTATYDATVVKKLREAGALFLGRTNMDEFAMGSSTENSAYGVTKNPRDLARVAGGSSGGSAAVVAGDLALASLGSDTGGSIREPASFCGVVGLKPTYGAVSRFGLIALGSSLDQIGPFAKTVGDAELLFDVMAGEDPYDSTSVPARLRAAPTGEKKVIGVPMSFIERDGIDPEVLADFKSSLERLKGQGFTIRDVTLPNLGYALAVYYIIQPAEASTNLARFDGVRYGLRKEGKDVLSMYEQTRGQGFGKESRRRIMLGAYVLSSGYYDAYYRKATAARSLIARDFAEAFNEVDAIAMPTSPTPAFKIGEKAHDPLSMYLADIFTVPMNLAGVPAISIPSGKTKGGLPLSLQLIAPHFSERTLFSIGARFEA
ncbi:Asp-tRNA(Asn)/Glu-tRNA(Gln) amidotransferase subunit GatA [Candidatus Parcubacteria bacterium]|nr:Asp-tRNA(Asn)/Glu-tRNA(Gln) amidotransferase subunit GatA [Candidatus Parcubacteria bacterium]